MKIMKNLFLVSGLVFLTGGSLTAGENLVISSDFSNKGAWLAKRISPETGKEVVATEEMLNIEQEDVPEGAASALRVTIKDPVENEYSHSSGLHITTSGIDKSTVLKVSFFAKSVSGARILSFRRSYGGPEHKLMVLSSKWEKYEFELPGLEYDTGGFTVCLVERQAEGWLPLAEGEFLLAGVVIEEKGKSVAETEAGKE